MFLEHKFFCCCPQFSLVLIDRAQEATHMHTTPTEMNPVCITFRLTRKEAPRLTAPPHPQTFLSPPFQGPHSFT